MQRKEFGKRLRELRENKGLSIKQLAPELQVTYTQLSNIELGYKKPSKEFIERLSAFFGIDKDEFTLAAGIIPDDISKILSENPKDAPQFLRSRFKKEEDNK